MRLFQLITFGQPYLRYFDARYGRQHDYASRMRALLHDRYGNSHLLEPIDRGDPSAFLAIADDEPSQRAWARANGLPAAASQEQIVLAQIEAHGSEVLYNITPLLYDTRFLRRLPGSVKRSICWRGASAGGADLSGYDLCVCNFPNLLEAWKRRGWRTAWFEPAHDPVASEYARARRERSIDLAFVGGYSRHHSRRNQLLQQLARLADRFDVRFHFSLGRLTRVANALGPLRAVLPGVALDGELRRVAAPPLYGRSMYELFGGARIVINAAIDVVQQWRGNMRCWEALGCGALMLSDVGEYPPRLTPGADFETYSDSDDAVRKVETILADYDAWRPMAEHGLRTMETKYSKAAQWSAFQQLVAST